MPARSLRLIKGRFDGEVILRDVDRNEEHIEEVSLVTNEQHTPGIENVIDQVGNEKVVCLCPEGCRWRNPDTGQDTQDQIEHRELYTVTQVT